MVSASSRRNPAAANMASVSRVRWHPPASGFQTGAPAFRMGITELAVDTREQRLAVGIAPSKEIAVPGSQLSVDLSLTGPDGKPVEGQVAVMVVDEAVRDEVLGPFERLEGVDMGPLRAVAVHRGVTMPVAPEALGGEGACFARHPFPGGGGEVHGEVTLRARGRAVGLVAWYDLRLSPSVTLSTAPDAPATHWAQCFLPLADPVDVDGALRLTVSLVPPPDDRRSLEVRVDGDLSGNWRVR